MMNERSSTLLTMDVSVVKEEREDRWAFYIQELGFTLYGKTEDECLEVVRKAINTLVSSLRHDRERLLGYLDAHGVMYRVENRGSASSNYVQVVPENIVRHEQVLLAAAV